MATSGDTTWQLQRDDIIKAAMRKINTLFKGQTPDAQDLADGSEALNAIIASLRADGMPVWAMKTYVMPLVAGQQNYEIGVGQALNTPMPMKLTQAIRIDTDGGTRVPLNIYTDYDFKLLSNFQSTEGVPVQIYYQPKIETGTLRFWPIPDTQTASEFTIELTYQRPYEEFDAATDTPDFPSYWTRALIYLLAGDLSEEAGVPLQDRQMLAKKAADLKEYALSFGTEEGSIRFMPDYALYMQSNYGD